VSSVNLRFFEATARFADLEMYRADFDEDMA